MIIVPRQIPQIQEFTTADLALAVEVTAAALAARARAEATVQVIAALDNAFAKARTGVARELAAPPPRIAVPRKLPTIAEASRNAVHSPRVAVAAVPPWRLWPGIADNTVTTRIAIPRLVNGAEVLKYAKEAAGFRSRPATDVAATWRAVWTTP